MRKPTRGKKLAAWTPRAARATLGSVKALWWGVCALSLALAVVFGSRELGRYTVVVEGPGAGSTPALPAAQCPPRTLPDEGACVPVPRPERSGEALTRLPARPEAFDGYALPAPGKAQFGTWADLSSAPERARGDALVIASPPGSPVTALALAGHAPVLLARGEDWLLFGASPANPKDGAAVLALLGPLSPEVTAEPGARLEPGTVLGKTVPGGLGLAVRRLRPNQTLHGQSELLDEARSVADDPRNVLPLRTP